MHSSIRRQPRWIEHRFLSEWSSVQMSSAPDILLLRFFFVCVTRQSHQAHERKHLPQLGRRHLRRTSYCAETGHFLPLPLPFFLAVHNTPLIGSLSTVCSQVCQTEKLGLYVHGLVRTLGYYVLSVNHGQRQSVPNTSNKTYFV